MPVELAPPVTQPKWIHESRRWIRGGILAVVDQGLMSGSNFALSILLARWLTSEQYGAYAVALSIFFFVSTVHQALLQLRGNGSFVLIVPEGPGPSGGTYTLDKGRLTVKTDVCGSAVGQYDVTVTGSVMPYGSTRATGVCCSITSLTRTAHPSPRAAARRHGRSRPVRANHPSRVVCCAVQAAGDTGADIWCIPVMLARRNGRAP